MSHGWLCLMYHDVASSGATLTGGPAYFTTPRASFADQLDRVQGAGFRGVSIAEALKARPAPVVGISFDDGDEGQFTHAFPEIVRRGMSATFFVTTTWVGRPGYASWDQLREMRAAGMSIQSHTRSHPFLSELSPDALEHELTGSKRELDEALDQDTDSLALPGGDAPRDAWRARIAAAGYRVVATSRWGLNSPAEGPGPLEIRRCTVRGAPSAAEFDRLLRAESSLFMQRQAREFVLHATRSALGPTRYARWRHTALSTLGQLLAVGERKTTA